MIIQYSVIFSCAYGIIRQKSKYLLPYIIFEGVVILDCLMVLICIPFGLVIDEEFNEVWLISMYTFDVIFAFYCLNGFYSIYKQIKKLEEEIDQQSFYFKNETQAV